jgi:hypothetical protein
MTEDLHALRVGVTGHRFLTEVDKLTSSLEKIFQILSIRYPDIPIEIASGLAEGADRLAAWVFLDHGATLNAILPLPAVEYESDFSSLPAVNEFREILSRAAGTVILPPQPDHPTAYKVLGDYLLQHSDLLLTLWDGKPSRSPGSTGDISTRARQTGLPLLWIHTGNRLPGTNIPTSLGEDQGKIEFINF